MILTLNLDHMLQLCIQNVTNSIIMENITMGGLVNSQEIHSTFYPENVWCGAQPIRKSSNCFETTFLWTINMVDAIRMFFFLAKNIIRIWLLQLNWRLVFVLVSPTRDTVSFVLSPFDYLLALFRYKTSSVFCLLRSWKRFGSKERDIVF